MNVPQKLKDAALPIQDDASLLLASGLMKDEDLRAYIWRATLEGASMGMEIADEVVNSVKRDVLPF